MTTATPGKRCATIDVGSNSLLLHVAERSPEGQLRALADRVEITRLGEGLQQTGVISEAAMERSLAALRSFRETMAAHQVTEIAAVGTMCLRTARNSADFVGRAQEELDLTIEVIPGEEEARLSYLAVRSGLAAPADEVVIFDVGGGSTEFIFGRGADIERRFSLNVGAIRLTEEYLRSDPVQPNQLQRLQAYLDGFFAVLSPNAAQQAVVGMGGTLTNMAAVMHEMRSYDASLIQGSRLSRAEVDRQLELYRSRTVEQRRELPGLQPKRADVILAGATIVGAVLARLGALEVVVSDRGIRHGLMADRFGDAA